ncbi:uncharacterized protein LOC132937370 [Metopolophium dirhodum]|uniref:uncharacterized protein LOC132937370 n=1 Tax=Metopolophium dirhodum TaxID=44670 RepID=UPI00298FF0C1|nr:uncharacterized protein LOC132937370 [Metopolophium dirhodum]XP_060860169.1 uncharacterized protein LOC132937370 [Metopolophium dirhodum]XP_060860170.1 uncharacterized protein LOC132937370 [Metopolophium dirhodum]XP_060860171.1 uncharacterized protein LOC132937370 [Metopolophium dirhodum]XP_060860172.1 uncharacterized protein LOC132937370 [Metopolophium dirhodum]
MATVEEIDEAEQLRFLALKSMVRRSSKKTSSNTDTDDQDILLLRAAALKTINNKSSLGNKDEKLGKNTLINEKKRSISSQVSPLASKKTIKLTDKKNNNLVNNFTNNISIGNTIRVSKHDPQQECKSKHKLESNIESQSNPEVINKDDIKKVIRNGSIQLSNLDSEKFNETMILRITFSSSESDDSSSECDVVKNKVITQKKDINNGALKSPVPIINVVDNHVEATDAKSLEDNKLKVNNCMQQICVLMRHCESEIEKRNQQVEILLQAYEKYQNYSESLRSILRSMKTVRDELSLYSSADH